MSRCHSPRHVAAVLAGFRALAVVPPELGLTAHAGAGCDRQRTGLQVADHHAGRQQFDVRGFLDVAFQFAGDRDLVGAHAAGQLGAGLDGEIALDAGVALELAGDAYAAAAFDLAFDGDVGGDQRFLAGQAGVGACDGRGRRGWGRARASTARRTGPVPSVRGPAWGSAGGPYCLSRWTWRGPIREGGVSRLARKAGGGNANVIRRGVASQNFLVDSRRLCWHQRLLEYEAQRDSDAARRRCARSRLWVEPDIESDGCCR